MLQQDTKLARATKDKEEREGCKVRSNPWFCAMAERQKKENEIRQGGENEGRGKERKRKSGKRGVVRSLC